ncbi:hypothetical protein CDA63_08090 [Hymenobacter amundsenii]|uniref:Uncharacterized protein n=1 Tax=Hymenobacter amundsenii TaxID=2006685 RepID=A0A246FLE0_9BACT|nr:hypothetical protein CDA63_08090 [Hymenobacter amundsenii]
MAQRAVLANCVQSLTKDSSAFFFNEKYELSEAGCAVIKRLARIDTTGNFVGVVSDYRVSDGSLLAQLSYQDGEMNGPVTLYYSGGQTAAQGQMLQNQRSGNWQYWYPNGQPHQTLLFLLDENKFRTIAYWDSTGVQRVVNGTGQWRTRTEQGLLAVGPVRQGLMDGTWKAYFLQSKELATTEEFEAGIFRHGHLAQAQASGSDYRVSSRLPLEDPAPFLRAQFLLLGLNCVESRQRSQFELLKTVFRLPSVTIGSRRWADRLAQRLTRYRESSWYATLPPIATVRCNIDARGRYLDFSSNTPALREVVRRLVAGLPVWQPASYENIPVVSYIDISLDSKTGHVRVLPAARLTTDLLPNPQPTIWLK